MNFNKYCVPLLLLCALLVSKSKQTESGDLGQDILTGGIPLVSAVVGMTVSGPVGPMILTSLKVMEMAMNVLKKDDGQGESISKKDFLKSTTEINNLIKSVDNNLYKLNKELTHDIQSYGFLEDMRNKMDHLEEACLDNMKIILNPNITGISKQTSMHAMLDYFSTFRETLRSFISKFIKAKGKVAASGEVNLFFDFMLRKARIVADEGDDCFTESTHTKLFKSFMYILKVLTDAYVMAISAHTVQYQNELKAGLANDAIETQKISLKLINQYKIDIKALMDKTKWALDKASRDIRNCGTFELKRGETFEKISFAHTLPQFKDWNYDKNAFFSIYTGPSYKCFSRKEDVKFDDYEIELNECTDGGLSKPASVEVFVNSSNSDWPYKFLNNKPTLSADQVLGKSKGGPDGLLKREYFVTRSCYTMFCPAFKKNAVAISTQIVRAKPGNVITGLRFRVDSFKIIYVDIQQGKFLDDLTVDPETVVWTKTPESNDLLYMNSNIRKIELGDVELSGNDYLTSIQLDLKNKDDGIMGLLVGGATPPNWTPSVPTGSSAVSKSNEVMLSECDNPDQQGADEKNIISKAPVPSKPYHVSFQPSDLNRDLGSTTHPWFDIREVYSDPPAPLKGCGILHQSVTGFSGFLSLKLKSSDLSRFVDYELIEQSIDTTKIA